MKFGNGSSVDICGKGSNLVKCYNGEELKLNIVLYMP